MPALGYPQRIFVEPGFTSSTIKSERQGRSAALDACQVPVAVPHTPVAPDSHRLERLETGIEQSCFRDDPHRCSPWR